MLDGTTKSLTGTAMSAAVLTSVVAIAAAILSFNSQAELARMTGVFPGWLPVLWPLVVDAFILQASLSLVSSSAAGDRHSRRYHWTMLATWSSVSLAANFYHALVVAHGALPPLVSASIAIVPPLALLASTHGLVVHLAPHTEPVTTLGHEATEDEDAQKYAGEELVSEAAEEDVDQPSRVPAAAVEITEAHMTLARAVRSRRGSKKSERDVARALALREAGYTALEIEPLIGGVAVRTTIARWFETADDFLRTEHADVAETDHTDSNADTEIRTLATT